MKSKINLNPLLLGILAIMLLVHPNSLNSSNWREDSLDTGINYYESVSDIHENAPTDAIYSYISSTSNIKPLASNAYINESIIINSDIDFETYGFNGTGSESDPYLIEDVLINNSNAYGIYVESTSKYFIIRDCIIDTGAYGIYLYDISSNIAKIENNTIFSSFFGIGLWHASGTSIIRNNISRYRYVSGFSWIGLPDFASIECRDSSNINIENNICEFALRAGVNLKSCDHIDIINNTFKYSPYGIKGVFVSNIDIYNCTFLNHWSAGIEFDGGSGTTQNAIIRNCQFEKCGVILEPDSSSIIMEDNTVNNKPLAFFREETGFKINQLDYGQIILLRCSKITISNQSIGESSIGISIFDCNDMIITNNELFKNHYGIIISLSSNIIVSKNNCSNNYKNGICVDSSSYSDYRKNICNDNNEAGISFDRYSLLNDNDFNSHHNRVFNNTIIRNLEGIGMWYTEDTEFSYNILQDNIMTGIGIGMNSKGIKVHHNWFINNCNNTGKPQGSQWEFEINILWYDNNTKQGNYWSDWNCKGPYTITCSRCDEDVFDLYPLYDASLHICNPKIMGYNHVFLILILSLLSLILIRKIRKNDT